MNGPASYSFGLSCNLEGICLVDCSLSLEPLLNCWRFESAELDIAYNHCSRMVWPIPVLSKVCSAEHKGSARDCKGFVEIFSKHLKLLGFLKTSFLLIEQSFNNRQNYV